MNKKTPITKVPAKKSPVGVSAAMMKRMNSVAPAPQKSVARKPSGRKS